LNEENRPGKPNHIAGIEDQVGKKEGKGNQKKINQQYDPPGYKLVGISQKEGLNHGSNLQKLC
jgi:hypothetical protein